MARGSFSQPDVAVAAANTLIEGTEEQQAVWHALLRTDKNVIVSAVAGSGKTTVLVQYALRERNARIGLVAFNKHIAMELTARVGGQTNVECMTYHSLGFRACKKAFGSLGRPDEYRVLNLLDRLEFPLPDKQTKIAKYRIKAVVGLAKQYAVESRADLERLVDHHDVDFSGIEPDLVYEYAQKILARCKVVNKGDQIDFDDMVWLPMVLGLSVPQFDVLCVDEYQDTGVTQQWLALNGGKRLCAVGDPRQAIYAFRGADGQGFDRLREKLGGNVVTLPLTLTRRCPKSHVRLAQVLVPQIQAMSDAPEGIVRVAASLDAAVAEMRAGDLVVCRVNAELIGTAYKLLKRGVKAVVRGRDIGKGITKLIDDAAKHAGVQPGRMPGDVDLDAVIEHAGVLTAEQVAAYNAIPHGRGEMRAANAQDRYDCLVELAAQARTVNELRAIIERLFGDFDEDGRPTNAVVLGTVHRTKGLEGNRVFVLRPDLIPHPMAKKAHDLDSERNLGYVAVTRSKFDADHVGELIFVGGMCPLFGDDSITDTDDVIDGFDHMGLGMPVHTSAGVVADAHVDDEEPEWTI